MKTILIYKYYLLLFFLIGIVVYFPIFFNGFVWDDVSYILNNPQIHHFNITILFDNIFNSEFRYRPILSFYYSGMYTLFGENAFPYHLLQLLLHIIFSFLLFLLFSKYFKNTLSFLLSLFFLIHPINAEAVLWISSIQTLLAFIPGILAVLIVHKKNLSEKDIILMSLCLLFSFFSYEAGILFCPIILLYLYLHKSPSLNRILFLLIGLFFVYMFLRILGHGFSSITLYDTPFEPPTLPQKLFTMPSIAFYYLKTLLFPFDLIIWQYWRIKEITFGNFILPTGMLSALIVLYFILFLHIPKNMKKVFYLFSVWFFIEILSTLQIIPLDMTVSDRWFYFPFIGLLGIIGTTYQTFEQRLLKYKILFISVIGILLCLYSVRTFYRSYDWRNDYTLFTHDIKLQPYNIHLNYKVALLYASNGKPKEALPYLEYVAKTAPFYLTSLQDLGVIYQNMGNYDKAVYFYKKAIDERTSTTNNGTFDIYLNLATSLMELKKYDDAANMLNDQVISSSLFPQQLIFIRAQALYKEKKYTEAQRDLKVIYKNTTDPEVDNLNEKIKEALKKEDGI